VRFSRHCDRPKSKLSTNGLTSNSVREASPEHGKIPNRDEIGGRLGARQFDMRRTPAASTKAEEEASRHKSCSSQHESRNAYATERVYSAFQSSCRRIVYGRDPSKQNGTSAVNVKTVTADICSGSGTLSSISPRLKPVSFDFLATIRWRELVSGVYTSVESPRRGEKNLSSELLFHPGWPPGARDERS